MSTDEIHGELVALAADRGWNDVAAFVRELPGRQERGVAVLCDPSADVTALRNFFGDWDPSTVVTIAELAPAGQDPGTTLLHNRVVVALPYGELMSPDTLAAATAVLLRPDGSGLVVVTGAGQVPDAQALRRTDRILWQSLLAGSAGLWNGQDLAEHRCLLLHAPGDSADDAVRKRLDRDLDRLREWFLAAPPQGAELPRMRLAYALDLADEADRSGRSPSDVDAAAADRRHRMTAAVRQIAQERADVLRRVDEGVQLLSEKLIGSLYRLEQRVLAGEPVEQAAQAWRDDARQVAEAHLDSIVSRAGEAMAHIDWALVNEAAPAPGGGSYPEALLACLPAVAETSPLDLSTPRLAPVTAPPAVPQQGVPAEGAQPTMWASAARGAAVGALLATATAFIIGPIGAGIVAAAGGAVAERWVRSRGATVQAEPQSPDVVAVRINRAKADLVEAVEAFGHTLRRGLSAEFERLCAALHVAATRPDTAPAADSTVGDSAARLAHLRDRLVAAAG